MKIACLGSRLAGNNVKVSVNKGAQKQAKTSCSVKSCDKPARTKGLCGTHYERLRLTGDVQAKTPIGKTTDRDQREACKVEDCERPAMARGWCQKHYLRWRKHCDPLKTVIVRHTGCSVEGCERPHHMKTYCSMHYQRWAKDGDPGPVDTTLQSREGPCSVTDCTEDVWAKGMCAAHYDLKRRNGSPDTRVRNRRKAADIPDVCEIEGCEKPYKMNGYCQMHAFRVREHGEPGPAEVMLQPQKGKTCKVPDCDRPAKSRDKCARHFRLELRHENPERAREEVLRRRTRQNENGMLTVTEKDLARLYASPCAECGATGKVEADHIIPVANPFGRTSIGNLQPLLPRVQLI